MDLHIETFYVETSTDQPEEAFTLSGPNSYVYYQQDRGTFFVKKKRPGDEIATKALPPAQGNLLMAQRAVRENSGMAFRQISRR